MKHFDEKQSELCFFRGVFSLNRTAITDYMVELRTVITDRNYGPYGRKTAMTGGSRIMDRNYGITDRNYGSRNYGLSVIQTQGWNKGW